MTQLVLHLSTDCIGRAGLSVDVYSLTPESFCQAAREAGGKGEEGSLWSPASHPASMPSRDLPALPCRAHARMPGLLHLAAVCAPYNVAPFCVCHHFSSQLCRDAVCRCNAFQQEKASVVLCLSGFRHASACLAVPRSRTLSLVLHAT